LPSARLLPPAPLQNVKMWATLGGVAALIIFFIVAAACGWNFSKC
jgi:hypothetical protein